ncbi:MAG: hypothetical protein AB1646_07215 [Thermodesulfobacteriota bacterium]
MKDESCSDRVPVDDDDLAEEYNVDYDKVRPNRFAPGVSEGSLVVILDPDIARVFKTQAEVKSALRGLIAEMERPGDQGA